MITVKSDWQTNNRKLISSHCVHGMSDVRIWDDIPKKKHREKSQLHDPARSCECIFVSMKCINSLVCVFLDTSQSTVHWALWTIAFKNKRSVIVPAKWLYITDVLTKCVLKTNSSDNFSNAPSWCCILISIFLL